MSLIQQNHTVTEGDTVVISLHLSTVPEFDLTVTLQHMDGSAVGESGLGFLHAVAKRSGNCYVYSCSPIL